MNVETPGILPFSQREAYMNKNKDLKLRNNQMSYPAKGTMNKVDKELWAKKTQSLGQSQREMPTSPYFKVKLNSDSMNKIRLASVEASLTNESQQYQTPASIPKNGPLMKNSVSANSS